MQYPKQTDNYNVDIFNSNFRELAENIISLDSEKFDKTEAQGLFKDVSFNRGNGIITFTCYNGSIKTIDTLLEKLAVNFDFDRETQRLVIILDDGTEKYVDLSAFVAQYEFFDSETIAFVLGDTGKVSAKIKDGSVEERHLRPDYLADIKVESAKAESAREEAQESQRAAEESEANAIASASASASNASSAQTAASDALEAQTAAEKSAIDAESYAHGGTGTREGEDTDNADFYYHQSKALHEDILAATEATEENAGLMSAHDKSWFDGTTRRYVYGRNSSSTEFNGYYKIASVETSTAHRTFGLAFRIWTGNFTNYAAAPMVITIYFRTNNNSAPSDVTVYSNVHATGSYLFKEDVILIKHTNNPDMTVPNELEKCEIYFNRNKTYGKIIVDVLGEVSIESASSTENYQNVWTFYDGSEKVESIEEDGFEIGNLMFYSNRYSSNAGNKSTPIFLENGILKPCTDISADAEAKRYVYGGKTLANQNDKIGYIKIADIQTSELQTYYLRLLTWGDSTYRSEFILRFTTTPAQVGPHGVSLYPSSDISLMSTNSDLKNLYLKYTNGSRAPLVELYWNRSNTTQEVVVDFLGEFISGNEGDDSTKWKFYDNFEVIKQTITEDDYVNKQLLSIISFPQVGSSTRPIYIDSKGVPKVCDATSYNSLADIPKINGVSVSGEKTPEDFNLLKFTTTKDLGINETTNAIGYVGETTDIFGISDGALFQQSYSKNWSQQIYGDYRTGAIATRGKNNGVWQPWRRQLDDVNNALFISKFDPGIRKQFLTVSDLKYIKVSFSGETHNNAGVMVAFTVRLYINYTCIDYLISGYNYVGDNQPWYNAKATIISNQLPDSVLVQYLTFGVDEDTNRLWVAIPTISNVPYPAVSIFGITNSYYAYLNRNDIASVFNIEAVSSLTGKTIKTIRVCSPVHQQTSVLYLGANGGVIRKYSSAIGFTTSDGMSEMKYECKAPVEGGGANLYVANTSINSNLGTSTYRWGGIYAKTAVNVSSDSREKIDQNLLDDELTEQFVLGLTPKSYKRIDGTSGRRHHGLIAQEIEELMEKLGISSLDFAGFIKSPKEIDVKEVNEEGEEVLKTEVVEGEYVYSLRYEEFLPMLVKMIQIQHDKIKVLEEENLQLSDRLSRIEEYLELA